MEIQLHLQSALRSEGLQVCLWEEKLFWQLIELVWSWQDTIQKDQAGDNQPHTYMMEKQLAHQ